MLKEDNERPNLQPGTTSELASEIETAKTNSVTEGTPDQALHPPDNDGPAERNTEVEVSDAPTGQRKGSKPKSIPEGTSGKAPHRPDNDGQADPNTEVHFSEAPTGQTKGLTRKSIPEGTPNQAPNTPDNDGQAESNTEVEVLQQTPTGQTKGSNRKSIPEGTSSKAPHRPINDGQADPNTDVQVSEPPSKQTRRSKRKLIHEGTSGKAPCTSDNDGQLERNLRDKTSAGADDIKSLGEDSSEFHPSQSDESDTENQSKKQKLFWTGTNESANATKLSFEDALRFSTEHITHLQENHSICKMTISEISASVLVSFQKVRNINDSTSFRCSM